MKKWLKLLLLPVTFGFAYACAYGALNVNHDVVVVYAEDGESVSSQEAVAEEAPKEEKKDNTFYENFLLPVLGGVSVTSVTTAIISIIFLIVKNKKLDEKVLAIEEKASEKYNQASEKYAQVVEIVKTINTIYEEVIASGKLNREVKDFLFNKVAELNVMAEKTVAEAIKVEKLTQVMGLLVELEAKVAKQSEEVIKSGIAKDVDEIVRLFRAI